MREDFVISIIINGLQLHWWKLWESLLKMRNDTNYFIQESFVDFSYKTGFSRFTESNRIIFVANLQSRFWRLSIYLLCHLQSILLKTNASWLIFNSPGHKNSIVIRWYLIPLKVTASAAAVSKNNSTIWTRCQ